MEARRRLDVVSQQILRSSPCSSTPYQPKKVLVTGGAGFIGAHVVIHLVKKYTNCFFVAYDNLAGGKLDNLKSIDGAANFVFVRGTITSEASLRQLIQQHQIDTVINFAAECGVNKSLANPTSFTETNVVGTQTLLKVSKECNIQRFLHVSDDTTPTNPYSASKAAAEMTCKGYAALPAIVLRPSNVYGPTQHPGELLPQLVMSMTAKKKMRIPGSSNLQHSFLHIQDAVDAFDLVLHQGQPGETYSLEGSVKKTLMDVAQYLLPHFKLDPNAVKAHVEYIEAPASIESPAPIDSSKIRQLGWAPKVSWEDGMASTIAWYLENSKYWSEAEIATALEVQASDNAAGMNISFDGQAKDWNKNNKIWYAPYKFQAYGDEEIQEVVQSLKDGWLAPGPRTEEFEKKIAALFAKQYGVMVNSGSSGNIIGLCSLGLKPGDEVVTPACTFSTVIAPLEQLGLKPVFCDVVPGRYVPTVDQVIAAITPKTKCLMIPNLVGGKIDWAELRRRTPPGIWLFEDSCDTITYTPESDISVISFYASHIITAGGLGGCIMYNDSKLRDKALMFRDWGRIGNNSEDVSERFAHSVDGIEYDFKFLYGCLGYNMKACEMNAAFGLAQLRKLDYFKAIRKRNINRYVENLRKGGSACVLPEDHDSFDWLAMPLMHPDRKGLLRYLEANDMQIRVMFSGNITRHPAYRHYLQNFPAADRIMAEGFLVGAHHGLSVEDVDRACELILKYEKENARATLPAASAKKGADSVELDF